MAKRPTAPVAYILFDLLWDNGRDLTGKSIVQRLEQLEEIITPVDGIQIGGYIENCGIDLFRLAKEKGLEGIIAKRKTSIYQPGNSGLSQNWCGVRGAFAEWTLDGELRQTTFLGWRDDKRPEEAVLELQ
jgi:ATP-dependent DNA ligase